MNTCEVLGITLGVRLGNPAEIQKESDFVIKPDLPVTGPIPLVLPNDRFTHNWAYTSKNVVWDPNNKIPYRNEKISGHRSCLSRAIIIPG